VPDFDTSVPHIARIYDYWLGGKDNFAADREAAERDGGHAYHRARGAGQPALPRPRGPVPGPRSGRYSDKS
jgi:hypothetical protein